MSSAAVQTSVNLNPDLGLPGQPYDSGPKTVITKIASEAIKFGKYVVYADDACELGDSSAEIQGARGGVALRDPLKAKGYYEVGDEVAVMVEGLVWVPVEETIGATDPVFVRFAGATAAEENGFFRNDTDGTTANAANPPGAIWEKGGTSVAVLRLGVAGVAGGLTGPTS
ncbi:MAG TPA: hypothetical protein VM493_02565 [Vicinamibacterales bacterium]|jgi:hypothetical protein|nr:hypothetical protein [Vicinamibacterales bacterium]